MFVHLRFYLPSQRLEPFAQGADKLGVAGVIALGVHVAVGLAALEVQADVVEGGVGVGVGLGMVVPPEVAACVHHCLRLGREDYGLSGNQVNAPREEVARFALLPAELSREEVGHEMGLELLLGIHLVLGVGDPVVDALRAADTVLAVEQGEGQAVVVELCVVAPAVVRPVELVAIVIPCRLNNMLNTEIDADDENIYRFYPKASGIWEDRLLVYDINFIDILKIISTRCNVPDRIRVGQELSVVDDPLVDSLSILVRVDLLFLYKIPIPVVQVGFYTLKSRGYCAIPDFEPDRELPSYIIKSICRH